MLRASAFYGFTFTDVNGKIYRFSPEGGDSSTETYEPEVFLAGPPVGFLGKKDSRIESMGVRQYTSFCSDADIQIAPYSLTANAVTLKFMQEATLNFTHATPAHNFDFFSTKCEFEYTSDSHSDLLTIENGQVIIKGNRIGNFTAKLYASIKSNSIAKAVPIDL